MTIYQNTITIIRLLLGNFPVWYQYYSITVTANINGKSTALDYSDQRVTMRQLNGVQIVLSNATKIIINSSNTVAATDRVVYTGAVT